MTASTHKGTDMLTMMNASEAYETASQWGSYTRDSDPGACFYGFRVNDGRPYSEEHRAECLAWGVRCLGVAMDNYEAEYAASDAAATEPNGALELAMADVVELRRLIAFHAACRLNTDGFTPGR